MSRQIPLTQGQTALVEDDDYKSVSKHKWYALWSPRLGQFYAVRKIKSSEVGRTQGTTVYMHREVLGVTDPKIVVDHIHHNTLDNRRTELQAGNQRRNMSNLNGKKTGKFSSKLVGVHWDTASASWKSSILIGKKRQYLGRFNSEEEAGAAYAKALKESQ